MSNTLAEPKAWYTRHEAWLEREDEERQKQQQLMGSFAVNLNNLNKELEALFEWSHRPLPDVKDQELRIWKSLSSLNSVLHDLQGDLPDPKLHLPF